MALRIVSNFLLQAIKATLFTFPFDITPDIENLGIDAIELLPQLLCITRADICSSSFYASFTSDHSTIPIEGSDANQGSNLFAIQSSQFRKIR